MRRVLMSTMLGVLGTLLLCVPAGAAEPVVEPSDAYNVATLNPLNAEGKEIPFKEGFKTVIHYNSSGYTLQGNAEKTSCGTPSGKEDIYGAKSGWTRFVAGVRGSVEVIASSEFAGQGPMVIIWEGGPGLGISDFTEPPLDRTCNALPEEGRVGSSLPETPGGPEHVQPNIPIQIQTSSICATVPVGTGRPVNCEDGSAAGGPMTVKIVFTAEPETCSTTPGSPATVECPEVPLDTDGDGIPDLQDSCQTEPGPAATKGCPDTDGDGIPNREDHCPTVKGTPANKGCPLVTPVDTDTDGDNIADIEDLCRSEFSSPAISELGDGRRGCPEPLTGGIEYDFGITTNRWAVLSRFEATVPTGSLITILCRGHACPHTQLASFVTKKHRTPLLSFLHRGRLRHGRQVRIPLGTTITATATQPGALGRRKVLTPRRTQVPLVIRSCVAPSGKNVTCP